MRDKFLFSGDTQLDIKSPGGSYTESFIDILEKLINFGIKAIYSGHDDPITKDADKILKNTLKNVFKSQIIS